MYCLVYLFSRAIKWISKVSLLVPLNGILFFDKENLDAIDRKNIIDNDENALKVGEKTRQEEDQEFNE